MKENLIDLALFLGVLLCLVVIAYVLMKGHDMHTMTLDHISEAGFETWICDTCGYTLSLHRTPHVTMAVIAPGDEAAHTGGHPPIQPSETPDADRLIRSALNEQIL